jgi:hypothetical protein
MFVQVRIGSDLEDVSTWWWFWYELPHLICHLFQSVSRQSSFIIVKKKKKSVLV